MQFLTGAFIAVWFACYFAHLIDDHQRPELDSEAVQSFRSSNALAQSLYEESWVYLCVLRPTLDEMDVSVDLATSPIRTLQCHLLNYFIG